MFGMSHRIQPAFPRNIRAPLNLKWIKYFFDDPIELFKKGVEKMEEENSLTTEERYHLAMKSYFEANELSLGPWASRTFFDDPKHISFRLARYKFCSKMLEGKKNVLEIGCGDGLGIPIVAQTVEHLHCVDWDMRNIEGCARRLNWLKNVTYECVDFNKSHVQTRVDAVYSIDLIEHLELTSESKFMENVLKSLNVHGILITGTPNISAIQYASKASSIHHINLKSQKTLRELMDRYFWNTFIFGMNDEVVHTGFSEMCHYIWSISVGIRPDHV